METAEDMKTFQMEVADANVIDDMSGTGPVDRSETCRMRKFWEAPDFFKCPIIGTCLSLKEQKNILRKAGIQCRKMSPFEVHEELVGRSDKMTPVSRKIDGVLNRKFNRDMAALRGLNTEQFLAEWKTRLKEGDTAAVLWAAAIRSDLPIEVVREIYGDTHMAMHLQGETARELNGRLSFLEDENRNMRQRLKDANNARRRVQKENQQLRADLDGHGKKLSAVTESYARLSADLSNGGNAPFAEKAARENEQLKERVKKLTGSMDKGRLKTARLEDRNSALLAELSRERDLNARLRREIEGLISRFSSLNRCDETCPSYDLCRKRVLIVGGISKLASYYRGLVERSGGIFEYHDGYMTKGSKKLEGCLRRADLVLCPVNCNSHNACSMVKSLGKKHGKPVHMLSGSSLSAVSQALWNNASVCES